MAGDWKVYNGFYYDERLFEEVSALVRFLDGKGDACGLMLISGPSGCGKTALANAIIREAGARQKRAGIFTAVEAARTIAERTEIDRPACNARSCHYEEYDLIVLEEYGDLTARPDTQWELCRRLLEPLLQAGKKVILTLVERRGSAEELGLPPHVRVRLAPADVGVRRGFVRDYTRELGVETDDDVEAYLAQNYPIHVIKGILHRGWLNGALTGRRFDMDKPEVLDRLYRPGGARPYAVQEEELSGW